MGEISCSMRPRLLEPSLDPLRIFSVDLDAGELDDKLTTIDLRLCECHPTTRQAALGSQISRFLPTKLPDMKTLEVEVLCHLFILSDVHCERRSTAEESRRFP
jgi:hypothetical protein